VGSTTRHSSASYPRKFNIYHHQNESLTAAQNVIAYVINNSIPLRAQATSHKFFLFRMASMPSKPPVCWKYQVVGPIAGPIHLWRGLSASRNFILTMTKGNQAFQHLYKPCLSVQRQRDRHSSTGGSYIRLTCLVFFTKFTIPGCGCVFLCFELFLLVLIGF
jgi:hypothetical protein